jgi:hypothetical protein
MDVKIVLMAQHLLQELLLVLHVPQVNIQPLV